MGKYMRKCMGAVGEEVAAMEVTQAIGVRTRSRAAAVAKVVISKRCMGAVGEEVAAIEVTQAVGVRTRSRAPAVAKVVVSKRRRPLLPSPLRRAAADAAAAPSSLQGGESGSCYLKLRSRMLFMAPPPSTPAPVHGAEAGQGAALAIAGLSRCSSTESSVDASLTAQDRSLPCRSDAAEAGSDNIRQGSASNNSESGHDRDRREATPSSHQLPGELSDLESDLAGQNHSHSLPLVLTPTQVQAAARARMPAAAEIEEFFAAAEEAEAKGFASKYNFDVTRGVPLDAGRFEWTPAVSRADESEGVQRGGREGVARKSLTVEARRPCRKREGKRCSGKRNTPTKEAL